ncbi:MAG: PDZ domain-containing protein, partial [Planctomycetota bacterium]
IANPSGTGESTGVGFAIPVNTLMRVVPQLIRNGRVVRADLGIASVFETNQGLFVAKVEPGGAADRAGIRGFRIEQRRMGPLVRRRDADLIVGIDGQPVATTDDLLSAVERHRPGERAVLTVIRAEGEVQVPVILGADD